MGRVFGGYEEQVCNQGRYRFRLRTLMLKSHGPLEY
jgi:hypothetical protein